MKEFKVGDVVRLKGMYCPMTVEIMPGGYVEKVGCVWFDDNDKLQRASFKKETLEKVPKDGTR